MNEPQSLFPPESAYTLESTQLCVIYSNVYRAGQMAIASFDGQAWQVAGETTKLDAWEVDYYFPLDMSGQVKTTCLSSTLATIQQCIPDHRHFSVLLPIVKHGIHNLTDEQFAEYLDKLQTSGGNRNLDRSLLWVRTATRTIECAYALDLLSQWAYHELCDMLGHITVDEVITAAHILHRRDPGEQENVGS